MKTTIDQSEEKTKDEEGSYFEGGTWSVWGRKGIQYKRGGVGRFGEIDVSLSFIPECAQANN